MGDGSVQAPERCGFCVLLFYLYSDDLPVALGLDGAEAVRAAHEALCRLFSLDGRLRVSREGLNGNLSGPAGQCEEYCAFLQGREAQLSGLPAPVPAEVAPLRGSAPSCDFKIAPCEQERCFFFNTAASP